MLHDNFYAEKNVKHTAKNSDKPVYTFENLYCGGSLYSRKGHITTFGKRFGVSRRYKVYGPVSSFLIV